jgi:UDP-glucose 4-epimerase
MTVFVTGGAGYIGSTVVRDLVEAGDRVVVYDNLYQGHRAAVHPEAVFVHGDLADRVLLDRTLAAHRPEAVMHFASHTLVGESMEKPFLYLGDNVRNGLNLLESAVAHGVQKFILSSTANLFGVAEEMPIQPEATIVPGSPYGESKYILERMLQWMDRIYGMRYAALRYFNACGAVSTDHGEDHSPETHIIPIVLQVALGQREHIVVYGDDYDTPDGTCVRDYVHIQDLSQAHILALRALDGGSRTYNLGNGNGFSLLEVVAAARQVTGHSIPVRFGARRPGDPPILIAGSERARRELGWTPRFTRLEQIIESAWAWHRAHPRGFNERAAA